MKSCPSQTCQCCSQSGAAPSIGKFWRGTFLAATLLLAATGESMVQQIPSGTALDGIQGTLNLNSAYSRLLPNAVMSAGTDEKKRSKGAATQSQPHPDFSYPVGPLGFAPPSPFYLGGRTAQVSLDFLDEDRLLFTFRVPGLISRIHPGANPGDPPTVDEHHNERHVRAVVLTIPSGQVTAEALWRLHDTSPYLWMLKDGRFLLRDRNTVRIGDADLHMELFLRFPGPVGFLELGPDQKLLVAETTEPPAADPSSENGAKPKSDDASSPGNPAMADNSKTAAENQDLLRIFRMNDRSILLFSRVNEIRHLPIDGEGFYEALRGSGSKWVIGYQEFKGNPLPLASIESSCSPALDVAATNIVLASGCLPNGARKMAAISRDKRFLWEMDFAPTTIWPLLATSANGLRLAREALEVSHSIGPNYPLDFTDIRNQSVAVFDLATGKLVISVPASPILDGGGNIALSPSGRRLAVLNDGAIQVYQLGPAAELPAIAAASTSSDSP